MAEIALRTGGCLCGAARFAARPASLGVDVCHCRMCRAWTGGVFMAVPCDDLAIEDATQVGAYRSSGYGERVFCKTCGSSLAWRMQDGSSAHAALSAFDDLSGFVFAQEIFIDEKPALYAFANETRKLTGPEFFARFGLDQEQTDG